jgi:hypothetical protein
MFELNAKELKEALVEDLKVNLVPMVQSSPGMGKSDIVKSIAKEHNLKLIDVRLSQTEPVDLQGFPSIVNGRMTYIPPENFPLDGLDEVPDGYQGWLLFLDEMNAAPLQVQAAAYKILLDRMVDNRPIHSRVRMIGAGNLTTDKAIVNRQSTATQSRLTHYRLRVDHEAWIEWANQAGIDHRVISFIKFKPPMLHRFDPNHSDMTFPCPRTWEFLSRMVKGREVDNRLTHVRMAGTIGEGPSTEFKTYTQIYERLPTIESVKADPRGWTVPSEASERYALTTMFSHNINADNIDTLIIAIERLPIEFQVVTMKDIYQVAPELKNHDIIKSWIAKNASKMF